MKLLDDVWTPLSAIAKRNGQTTYTLTITGTGAPTDISISNDGGATSVSLTDAILTAPAAVDLVLSHNASIKADLGTTVVDIT